MSVYYCPFDSHNPSARLILLGITPGFTQMELACRSARSAINEGKSEDEVCLAAKALGSFAGSMRANLVRMLDEIGLGERLGIPSSATLFSDDRGLLHTASVIRYAVFKGTQNYTGQAPRIIKSKLLMRLARTILAPELASVPNAVIIPLGKSVEEVLQILTDEKLVASRRWIKGFPHPSSANGHRARIFRENRESLSMQLRTALS